MLVTRQPIFVRAPGHVNTPKSLCGFREFEIIRLHPRTLLEQWPAVLLPHLTEMIKMPQPRQTQSRVSAVVYNQHACPVVNESQRSVLSYLSSVRSKVHWHNMEYCLRGPVMLRLLLLGLSIAAPIPHPQH
jgi:hypothetical protein